MQLKERNSRRSTKRSNKPNIGIITYVDVGRAGDLPLDNLIALLNPLAGNIYLITGADYSNSKHEVKVIRTKAKNRRSLASKVAEQALVHLRISRILSKLRHEIEILVFFNGTALTLPLIFARSFGIRCVIVVTYQGTVPIINAIRESGIRGKRGELVRLHIQGILERLSYFFANELIVYSPSITDEARLRTYTAKTVVAGEHFVNFERFRPKNSIEQRDDVVGYVGRLKEEKGVLHFIEAVPEILRERPGLRFTVIGEGSLRDEIQELLDINHLSESVKLFGWVSHDELPTCLNKFKLVVIPSYTEGLPNIMLECMACGVPVLATPVGAIRDIIKDGKTGFLLDNNAPACIARNVIRAISSPELESIAENAYVYVRERFTYARVLETWSEILSDNLANSADRSQIPPGA